MKYRKLFALAVAMLCTAGARAQTDVTSQYLTNADFEGTYTELYTINTGRYVYQPNGWTVDYKNVSTWNMTVVNSNDAMASNFTGTYAVPADNQKYMVRFRDNQSSEYIDLSQSITITTTGVYTFSADLIREDGSKINVALYAGSNSVSNSRAGTWENSSISVSLDAGTEIKVGIRFTNLGATGVKAGADNVRITYADPLDVARDAWEEAKAAAEAAIADDAYANVDGSEKAALESEIGKAEPTTADGYDEAAAALQAATSAFTAAKANYDLFAQYGNVTLQYADASKKPVITSESTAASIIPALRAYYESHALAEGVDGALNMTDRITNASDPTNNNGWTWTGSKNNPASNESWTDADGTNAHSYFDGGNWSANSWTTTMKQDVTIPAGRYLLTVKARAAENVTFTMEAGTESVALPHVGNTGNVFDRGWGDASVEFETDGSDVTIKVTASTSTVHEWFSISDFRLVRLELYTEMAKASDYAALNAAIASAKAKTLGFDAGEYAPYKNMDAIKAIATAEAIDQSGENAKDDITALTATLTNGWTANNTEVEAIYDGQFANTEANSTSGDIMLPGWTKVEGIRLLVKDETTNPGLAYTDGKAALFSWGGTTITYGEQDGYTLPLNTHKLYVLTMKVSGWRDGDLPTVVEAKLDGVGETESSPAVARVNDSEGNPFVTLRFYLKPTADNSILTIYSDKHFTVADLSLKATTVGDANGDGEIDAEDVDALAQIAVGKVTRHKNAADMNYDGQVTVSDVTRLVNLLKVTNVIPTGEPNEPAAVPAFKDLGD